MRRFVVMFVLFGVFTFTNQAFSNCKILRPVQAVVRVAVRTPQAVLSVRPVKFVRPVEVVRKVRSNRFDVRQGRRCQRRSR